MLIPAAVVVALVVAVGSYAYLTNTGSATATPANVGTLNPPTNVTAGPASGSTVPGQLDGVRAWRQREVKPQGYYVQRYLGSTPNPACGTVRPVPTTATVMSCNDTGVPAEHLHVHGDGGVQLGWSATSGAERLGDRKGDAVDLDERDDGDGGARRSPTSATLTGASGTPKAAGTVTSQRPRLDRHLHCAAPLNGATPIATNGTGTSGGKPTYTSVPGSTPTSAGTYLWVPQASRATPITRCCLARDLRGVG